MKRFLPIFVAIVVSLCVTACQNSTDMSDLAQNFDKSMFLGDSITEGFVFNEILPEENVVAGAGTTAGFIYEDIDSLFEKKPDNVFIMLGSIDLYMPVDNPKELFKTDLTKLINRIKEELPECNIYLQSILPVTEAAVEKNFQLSEIDVYNDIVIEVSKNLSIKYVDIGNLARSNPDLYAEDGVHFKKDFYYLWLRELLKVI